VVLVGDRHRLGVGEYTGEVRDEPRGGGMAGAARDGVIQYAG
jgi:hypothetical protein